MLNALIVRHYFVYSSVFLLTLNRQYRVLKQTFWLHFYVHINVLYTTAGSIPDGKTAE